MSKLVLLTIGALLAASGSAMAADLATPAPAPIAAPAPISTWDGPYIGAFIGYGWGSVDVSNITANGTIVGTTLDTAGFQVGIQGGYNFHLSDNIVAGVSADFGWDNGNGSAPVPNTVDVGFNSQMNWAGSVTGRLGVDVNGIVPYILAGVAFTGGTASANNGPVDLGSVTQTFTGFTVGAGAEFSVADNVSLDVEYRYANYGSQNIDNANFGATVPSASLTTNSIRAGLNYHF